MTKQGRQLAAIMFVDIKGFSEKMGEDEVLATRMRQKLEGGLKEFIPLHNGDIVKQLGDGALCLFNSAIEAVNAAIELQLCMRIEPVVPVRIGIHTGEVMIDHNDVYGDVVNIASRVESFAFAGGVFISGKVYDEIKNQPGIKTLALGKFEFTNIKIPVEVYAITNEGIAVPNVKRMTGKGVSAYKRRKRKRQSISLMMLGVVALSVVLYATVLKSPDSVIKNTVAVMPFKNLSENKENDFFSDGITEDILTQISKINNLNVLSQSTTVQLKNNTKSIQELGEELHVGYILQGSVRRAVDQIRISAQLVDASTGKNVWAETYDREYSKVFEIQSEIARFIATVLKAKLSLAEKSSINKKPTDNLSAYEYYLRGREHYHHFSKEDNLLAIGEFKMALSLDDEYSLAWSGLADAFSQKSRLGLPQHWLDSSKAASEQAIKFDKKSSEAYKSMANFYLYTGDYDMAKSLLLKAITLNPNNAAAIGNLGSCYLLLGQMVDALKWEKQSAVLEPKKFIPFYIVGWIYRLLGDYNMAEQWLKKSLELKPITDTYFNLAYNYLATGRIKEAKNLVSTIIKLDSTYADNYQIAGVIAQMSGDHNNAAIYFEKAIELDPAFVDNPDFFAPVGLAYQKQKAGKFVDAELILSKALAVYPDTAIAASNRYDRYIFAAAAAAMVNKKELSIAYLNKAAEANWIDYFFVEKNAWFTNVSNEQGFKTLMTQLKYKAAEFRRKANSL